ncbi:MAG: endo-1,4-beta-xylanase [candidate division KSB1 bacterium]|nr:endo-1,4-beta-xylanase [candidate division KSB1 bacterium]
MHPTKPFSVWLITLMLLFIFSIDSALAQVAANTNGGFEATAVTAGNDTTDIEGWTFAVEDYARVRVVDDPVKYGERALSVSVDSAGANSWDVQIVNEPFPVEPGKAYDFSVWARASESGVTAHFTAGDPEFNEFGRIHEAALGTSWKKYSMSFSVPVDDTSGRAPIHVSFAGNVGKTIYFDELVVLRPTVNANGSFERSAVTQSGDTSAVDGWSFNLGGDADADFAIVDDPAQDGNRALAVTVHSTGTNAWDIEALSTNIPVIPGESYTYSVWVKASESSASTHLTVGNPSFQEFMRNEKNSVLTTNWQQFTDEFTVPASDPDIARGPIHFNFASNVGKTIYIDDLRIEQIIEQEPVVTNLPIILEAEDGVLGDEFAVEETADGSAEYITITTDYNATTGAGDHPGVNRTASYEVTFPDTGAFDLFARVYVGVNTYDDDSFFHGMGFGDKDPDAAAEWVMVNGLATGGFSDPAAVVKGPGGVESEAWKWVNLSQNAYQSDTALVWVLDSDELTRIFEIGARENGLRIDKFAFGRSDLFFTVENLDHGEPGSEETPELPYTRSIAHGKEKFLGNIYASDQIEWFDIFWNQVTPENAGKWGSVERTRDQMNWTNLDEAYALAKDNDLPYRHHVLVWGNQQPNWIAALDPEDQLAEIQEWFTAVADRYPDADYVEVVNEPLHDPPDSAADGGYMDALGGSGETGWDWIITAFEMAREQFPDANLMINDYGIIGSISAANRYLNIIELLQERNLIDGIGIQCHAFSTRGANVSTMRQVLKKLADTGLPIQVTELDIDGSTDQIQLDEYKRVFPVLWEHWAVEGITLWGWRTGLWREDAVLMTERGERPALEWLRAYVDTASTGTHVAETEELPSEYKVYNNYPNPFNPSTQIMYDLPERSRVTLEVFDIKGRRIQTLVNEIKNAGSHRVTFNADRMPSGVYFYRLSADDFTRVKRMMLIK